jgi:hypothetical protein
MADVIRAATLLIWDEVPMQHKFCFEAVDRCLQDIRGNQSLFGGIPTLFGGDFAQILPVVRRGSRAATVQACIQRSYIWPQLKLLHLTENMRVRSADEQNSQFIDWLRGLSYDPTLHGMVDLPSRAARFHHPLDLIETVYPRQLLAQSGTDPDFFTSRSILASRNNCVREINDILISRMPGETTTYLSEDAVDLPDDDGSDRPPVEVLHTLEPNGLPRAKLRLKVGIPIMLMRNINPEVGLCNGTRLLVTRLGRSCIEARGLTGKAAGVVHLIPRIKLTSDDEDFGFKLTRRQFPIQVCFAMTINKSQGQSFNIMGVDLRYPVFTHGQFYVAMSRITNVYSLSVLLPSKDTTRVWNEVFPEVLLDTNT